MAQRKPSYFSGFGIAFQPRLAGEGDASIPSPVHSLHGNVEAQFSRKLRHEFDLDAENTMDDGIEKFPGWVRAGILAVPTIVLWGGVAALLRSVI
jgi:hypothetical protein